MPPAKFNCFRGKIILCSTLNFVCNFSLVLLISYAQVCNRIIIIIIIYIDQESFCSADGKVCTIAGMQVTLQHMLIFFTGADREPPLGFPKPRHLSYISYILEYWQLHQHAILLLEFLLFIIMHMTTSTLRI